MDTIKTENMEEQGASRLLIAGTALVLTGLLAIVFPFATTLAVDIMVGGFLVAAGVVVGVQAFSEKDWKSTLGEVLVGVVYAAGGLAFLINPVGGAVALTTMLGIIFAADGICRCVLAFWFRSTTFWVAALLSGCFSVLLGVLVLAGLANGASLAFIGLLVGVNFLLSGTTLLTLGWNARSTHEEPDTKAPVADAS